MFIDAVVDSGGVCALAAVDNNKVDVVGDVAVFTIVAAVVVFREVVLVRTGMVVFHWWVEKGLVTLAGSVMSWSPTVDRSDSGTVGRSQAGRLLMESSAKRKYLPLNHIFLLYEITQMLLLLLCYCKWIKKVCITIPKQK